MLVTKRQAMTAERKQALDELIDQAGGPVANRETGENELVLAGVLCTHDMEPDLDKWAVAHFKRETVPRLLVLCKVAKTRSPRENFLLTRGSPSPPPGSVPAGDAPPAMMAGAVCAWCECGEWDCSHEKTCS